MRSTSLLLAAAPAIAFMLSGCAAPILMAANIAAACGIEAAANGMKADSAPRVVFTEPLAALPRANHFAIWPDNEVEPIVAERLSASYTVMRPEVVGALLEKAGAASDLNSVTPRDLDRGFAVVCRHLKGGIVLAAVPDGSARSTKIVGYSCPRQSIVWRQSATLTGSVTSDNEQAVIRMAADAFAGRVVAAEELARAEASN